MSCIEKTVYLTSAILILISLIGTIITIRKQEKFEKEKLKKLSEIQSKLNLIKQELNK